MIKVPFDWEVFQKNDVVIEFLSLDHIDLFSERYFPGGVPNRRNEELPTLRQHSDSDMFYRFSHGVWQSWGDLRTYMDAVYNGYLHMVYDPNLDVLPGYVEVGDLL